jgi:hypothetical protein
MYCHGVVGKKNHGRSGRKQQFIYALLPQHVFGQWGHRKVGKNGRLNTRFW